MRKVVLTVFIGLSGAATSAQGQQGITVIEPCATRVLVRNAAALAHQVEWTDPASGERVVHRVPAHTRQPFSHITLALRIPSDVALSIDGRPSTHTRSVTPCVRPLPANAPDSIPDDYGHLSASFTELHPGMRFPGVVMLSFNPDVTRAQRDSLVLTERLELVGGARVGWRGYGIWAFWVPDDHVATNARALAARLNAMPAIRRASLNGLRRDVPNSSAQPSAARSFMPLQPLTGLSVTRYY